MKQHKIIISSLAIAFLVFGSTMHGMDSEKVAEQKLSTKILMQLTKDEFADLLGSDGETGSIRAEYKNIGSFLDKISKIIGLKDQVIANLLEENRRLKDKLSQQNVQSASRLNNPFNL